jgi:hypothetical protein
VSLLLSTGGRILLAESVTVHLLKRNATKNYFGVWIAFNGIFRKIPGKKFFTGRKNRSTRHSMPGTIYFVNVFVTSC